MKRVVPSFKSVPDAWKSPIGPYIKAPEKCGGRWYRQRFTQTEPWKHDPNSPCSKSSVETDNATPEFLRLFPRPDSNDFHDQSNPSQAFREAKVDWDRELKWFNGIQTLPEGVLGSEFDMAKSVAQHWNIKSPVFYEGRYGLVVIFLDTKIGHWKSTPMLFIEHTHHMIAQHQVDMIQQGVIPNEIHPFVPTIALFEADNIVPGFSEKDAFKDIGLRI